MLYRFLRIIGRAILLLLRRWDVSGAENVPGKGGLIVASNHASYWDPVVLGCALPRQIYFLAKAELFAIPFLGPLITALGAFPVHRSGQDAGAVKRALQLLKEERIVGIFPEGTRSHSGELLPAHMGAAMLALRARVPVLPVALAGTRGVFGKVRVVIGKPLDFSGIPRGKDQYAPVAAAIMNEIAGLLKKSGGRC
jgi:1-acyl-sn-glycerol-3-phosphate acyltransferase